MLKRVSVPVAAALLSASCSVINDQNMLRPGGPAARTLASANTFILWLFVGVVVVMWVLLWWIPMRRRGTLTEHASWNDGGDLRWVFIGGITVPVIVLAGVFLISLRTMAAFPLGDQAMHGPRPVVQIIGHQWWWEVHYLDGEPYQQFTTANEIHIPAHRAINIELRSADVMHSFWVPSLHGKVDLIPGHPNFIRVESSAPGNYSGQCAEYCGAQHAHMRLLVVAQEPDEYEAWVEQQHKPGSEPTTPNALAGEQVFLAGPCSMCHQVRGTPAGGTVAPDLTHIGSRRYIAANSFDNNNAYLEAWVTHAQSLKPGAQMPDLTRFNGEQLQDLVAYLRQLK